MPPKEEYYANWGYESYPKDKGWKDEWWESERRRDWGKGADRWTHTSALFRGGGVGGGAGQVEQRCGVGYGGEHGHGARRRGGNRSWWDDWDKWEEDWEGWGGGGGGGDDDGWGKSTKKSEEWDSWGHGFPQRLV